MTDIQNSLNELGALRSDINMTLHTHYATRVWAGRPWSAISEDKTDGNDKENKFYSQIISMPHCLSILNQVNTDAANDDPYADQFLIALEEKIISARKEMQALNEQIYTLYANQIPEGIDIQRCQNVAPVTMPIYIKYPLGYILVYLLTDYDSVARAVLTASHIAIMTKADAKAWMQKASHLMRSVFGMAQQYRHSGVTRQDLIENNARAQSAVTRLGNLPQDILDGTKRSGYAPIIKTNNTQEQVETEIVDGQNTHSQEDN
ncbi:PFL_4669 family integrating conjugative element protein [Aggregatibacter actinomycetemcomitans]|uniref:PFL_4669 family integrating conjugative element protein n=1 Tax=Aggregatibacter actinomycetemcomitans TaxID=714 RepID=UPI00024001B5|nr:TIGR03761 family integrating conjugative element protein [Aggregatibacter actinomycetemcomitans]EHK90216.1 hypothetical protein RHAA1_05553 [Aggregatibacter actinomycetemcomitans RhAA1]KNE77288.1 hypothetical protein RHAA2_05650 [Aggregatibacter actinomycetemcomitans RhAA1]